MKYNFIPIRLSKIKVWLPQVLIRLWNNTNSETTSMNVSYIKFYSTIWQDIVQIKDLYILQLSNSIFSVFTSDSLAHMTMKNTQGCL